jgi:hypothetical protein
MAWFLAWTPHALWHGTDPFVTTLLDHPATVDLADNTSVPLLGVLAAPVTLTLGPVAALNLMLRLALFSSAAAMCWLLRRVCSSNAAAFLGGAVYAFGPYIAGHASPGANLDLVMVPLPPLLIAALDELVRRRRHGALGAGLALGALAGAQLLVDPEVLADVVLTVGLAAAVLALVERRRLRWLLAGLSRRLGVATGAALALFGALAAGPAWAMLAAPGRLNGPVQPVRNLQGFHLDLAELVLPPARQLVDTSALAAAGRAAASVTALNGGPEHGGYLGLPLVALCIGLALRWRRDPAMRLGVSIALVALVASLGPRLGLYGHLTLVPLPEALLGHLPLLDSSIPARFGLEVALGAAIVLAVGVDRSLRAWAARPIARAGLLVAGACALACYLPAFPLACAPLPPERGVLDALRADLPSGAVVLSYPYALPPYDEAMLWQALDSMRFTLVGGYVTVPAGHGGQYWPPLLDPPSVQEAFELDEIGRPLHYPRPGRSVPSAAALCSFAGRYGVDAVVMRLGRLVPQERAVERSLTDAFGAPLRAGSNVLVWRDLHADDRTAGARGGAALCRRGAGGAHVSGVLSTSPSGG